MCNRFLLSFVDSVIEKNEEEKIFPYYLIYIDADYRERFDIKIQFKCKRKELVENFSIDFNLLNENYIFDLFRSFLEYDGIKKLLVLTKEEEEIIMGDEENDFLRNKVKNIFKENKLKIFEILHLEKGLLNVFDEFEHSCGKLCLIEDKGYVITKLIKNGIRFC